MNKNKNVVGLAEKFSQAAASRSGRVHLIPSGNEWYVKKEGISRLIAIETSEEDALDRAKRIKSVNGIIIHSKDGSVLKKVSTE